jgi:glycosyltransferase involved in cell wall biosynthesis
MKTLDLYTYCYNNEDFMPFFLDYYTKIVDRITLIDNGSTDKTLDIIRSYAKVGGCAIRVIHSGMTFWDWDLGLVYRNSVWKESQFDIIIWADPDEIIYKKEGLRQFLESNDYDIYQTIGYDMVSNVFPKAGISILDIKTGTRAPLEDKFIVWKRGSNVESTSAHTIANTTEKISKGEITLLHYKYLGVEHLVRRAADIKARVPEDSICKGIGGNILKKYPGFVKTRQEYIEEIAYKVSKAINVI